ncbi:hypothetical protein B0T16DRAFT_25121 [Cercophora newfieldiana]|uniref:Uncharacterized protein n=1 Tax=Cercophora newfieldiana TaxID=92897 RepID=A0AA39YNV1_9PEZI|nr:hypothetical protein B0T16DRAFT_25121 [Cercophora newfieldiana]
MLALAMNGGQSLLLAPPPAHPAAQTSQRTISHTPPPWCLVRSKSSAFFFVAFGAWAEDRLTRPPPPPVAGTLTHTKGSHSHRGSNAHISGPLRSGQPQLLFLSHPTAIYPAALASAQSTLAERSTSLSPAAAAATSHLYQPQQ